MKTNFQIMYSEKIDDFWIYPKLTSQFHSYKDEDETFSIFLKQFDLHEKSFNLYIHIPFCEAACTFCPYYKEVGNKNYFKTKDSYLQALLLEIEMYASQNFFTNKFLNSIHIGGGNPLMLSAEEISQLVEIVKIKFNTNPGKVLEISVEGTPASIRDEQQIVKLIDAGVTRISVGIQCFDEELRKKLNIKSTTKDIYRCVEVFRKINFSNYCFDLMYNLPDQSKDDLKRDIHIIDSLNPYYIDLYNMTVFPNTALYNQIYNSSFFNDIPTEKKNLEMYIFAVNELKKKGYHQITKNTFSKYICKIHEGDRLYLDGGDVLALGPSARGYLDGNYYKNICNIENYIEKLYNKRRPINLITKLTNEEKINRKIVFWPIKMYIKKKDIPNTDFYNIRFQYLLDENLIIDDKDQYVLTDKGTIFSGNISALFIPEKIWCDYMSSFINAVKKGKNPYNEDYMGKGRSKGEKL